jgi:hypothetical protein
MQRVTKPQHTQKNSELLRYLSIPRCIFSSFWKGMSAVAIITCLVLAEQRDRKNFVSGTIIYS